MTTLSVLIGHVLVGHLGEAPDGRVVFRFAESYRTRSNRPILGQRFEDDLERTYVSKRPGQLPSFFANLLPEGQLRTVIERSLRQDSMSDLDLLLAAEPDLPGAVRLRRADSEPEFENDFDAGDERSAPTEDFGLRFSLAGAQLKFSAIRDDDRFTVPARDHAGDWIVKVSIADYEGLAENEYTTLEWARRANFVVPECMLVPYERLGALRQYIGSETSALAVRRYDRDGARRIHQEDFNQVLGRQPRADGSEKYEFTYEGLGVLVHGIAGAEAVREFVRRLLFVVASGNNDAHLKNWSLIYADEIHPTLTPLYDQVATVAWPRLDKRLALKLVGTREFGRIGRESFIRLGRILGIENDIVQIVDEALVSIRGAWRDLDGGLLLESHKLAIEEHWTKVPLLREFGSL